MSEVERWKLDAGLSAKLETSGLQEIEVIVRVKDFLTSSEISHLEDLGVRGVSDKRRVFTAKLASTAIAELSNQHWVQSLKISRPLRPLKAGILSLFGIISIGVMISNTFSSFYLQAIEGSPKDVRTKEKTLAILAHHFSD